MARGKDEATKLEARPEVKAVEDQLAGIKTQKEAVGAKLKEVQEMVARGQKAIGELMAQMSFLHGQDKAVMDVLESLRKIGKEKEPNEGDTKKPD